MLTTKQETIGICLFELPEKDQAVIQRVVSFAASQGKDYRLQPVVEHASVIITLEDSELPRHTAVLVRVGDADLPCDIILQRPLLVTRVMRAIDDAVHILTSRPIPAQQPTVATIEPPLVVTTPEPEITSTPSSTHTDEHEYIYTALVVDDSAARCARSHRLDRRG